MELSWESIKSGIHPGLFRAIEKMGFEKMKPVQAATIPAMLNYKDVAAEAVTGSGKTIAFLLPLIQILLRKETSWKAHHVGAIVLSPTRELALQTKEVLESLVEFVPSLTYQLLIGGTPIAEDFKRFATDGANIIIATPGRLEDLMLRQEGLQLVKGVKYLEVLILDEADCLLSLGFEKSLNSILQLLPKQRRTGLFSATQTSEILKLIRAGLRNPVSVVVRDTHSLGRVPSTLDSFYTVLPAKYKLQYTINFIKAHKQEKILIFFPTCACVQYFSFVFRSILKEPNVSLIHGKMKEKVRISTFNKFRDSSMGILCCTDVMARGIDISKKIDWVVQWDPPSQASSYLHRSGRTARNGEPGKSLLILQESEANYVEFLNINQKVKLEKMEASNFIDVKSFATLTKNLRKFQIKDRSVYDMAMRAFVSYCKAYTKYECNFILRAKDLDLGSIATCYGLVKFPKMSELWGKVPENFEAMDIDTNTIAYKNNQRETKRKKNLESYLETGKWPSNGSNKRQKVSESTPWSKCKEEKALRKEKKSLKFKKKSNSLTDQEIKDFMKLEKAA